VRRGHSGLWAGILAYTLWGAITIYWKQFHRFNAFELIAQRTVWSTVVLVVVLMVMRKGRSVLDAFRSPRTVAHLALLALLLATNWTTYVYAVVHGHVIETALGYFISPIGTMLIGVFAMKERLRVAQWCALGLAVCAVAVVGTAYGQVPWLAIVLGTSWCAYGYAKRQIPLAAIESLSGEILLLLAPAVVLVAIRQGDGAGIFSTGTPVEIALLLCSGIVTATPLLLFAYSAKRTPFTVLGPVGYLVPSINFVLGAVVYHEQLTAARVIGFSLVWLALAIMTVDGLR